MTFVHGKGTVVTLDGDDLSAYSTSVTFTRTVDTHEVTTFGKSAKVYAAGLTDGTGSIEGIYDSTASTGPGAILRPLTVTPASAVLVYRPEGAGSGKPEAEVDVIINSYEESAPVADMITWTAEFQMSDTIDDTAQS